MVKKVCVGSTNKVKIESARAAFTKVFPEESFEFFGGRAQLSQRTTPYDAIMPIGLNSFLQPHMETTSIKFLSFHSTLSHIVPFVACLAGFLI